MQVSGGASADQASEQAPHGVVVEVLGVVEHATGSGHAARRAEGLAARVLAVPDVGVLVRVGHGVVVGQHLWGLLHPPQDGGVAVVCQRVVDVLLDGGLAHRDHRHAVADVELERVTHTLGAEVGGCEHHRASGKRAGTDTAIQHDREEGILN